MKEQVTSFLPLNWKKRLSRTRKWLVIGLFLTLIASVFSDQHAFYNTDDWGGAGIVCGYPFPFLSVISKHYWISNENTVSTDFKTINFMINLLFYSTSSYLVAKTAVFLDNNIPLNKAQKTGIILIAPYTFLQAIGLITRPFANALYRQTLGLRLYYTIHEMYTWYYDYLVRIDFTKQLLTLSLSLGIIIFIAGSIDAVRKNISNTPIR